MLNASEMGRILAGVPTEATVFVSYTAGRPPTERAILEAQRWVQGQGMARRHFVGKLHRVWESKNGDLLLTILCDNRDKILPNGTLAPPNYRTINPNLGKLISLEIISMT